MTEQTQVVLDRYTMHPHFLGYKHVTDGDGKTVLGSLQCFFRSITGKEHNHILTVSDVEITNWFNGVAIQTALNRLTSSEREMFMTGMDSEEWDSMFSEDDM